VGVPCTTREDDIYIRDAQVFQNSRSHLKITGATDWATRTKFHTVGLQILKATVRFSRHGDLAPGICLPLIHPYKYQSEICTR
jgi:hypothetical protein